MSDSQVINDVVAHEWVYAAGVRARFEGDAPETERGFLAIGDPLRSSASVSRSAKRA